MALSTVFHSISSPHNSLFPAKCERFRSNGVQEKCNVNDFLNKEICQIISLGHKQKKTKKKQNKQTNKTNKKNPQKPNNEKTNKQTNKQTNKHTHTNKWYIYDLLDMISNYAKL